MGIESPMYIYATEMVASYYSRIDLVRKSVLTIVGSGDQIINAYFFGAEKVVGFDINQRTLLFFDLKLNALKKLDFEEFLRFFGTNSSNGTFETELYQKFSTHLKPEVRELFDGLYENLNGKKMPEMEIFRQRSFLTAGAQNINAYLKDEVSYKKMQEIIQGKEPELMSANILELPSSITSQKFDIINLSNIPNYLVAGSNMKTLLGLLTTLGGFLMDGGIIFSYFYSPLNFESGKIPEAAREESRALIAGLDIFEMKEIYFPGASLGEDKILILRKK